MISGAGPDHQRLHDELTKLAAEDHRTVSAYCELLLERAVEESKRKK
jgi:hypothetical protein